RHRRRVLQRDTGQPGGRPVQDRHQRSVIRATVEAETLRRADSRAAAPPRRHGSQKRNQRDDRM
ncbi:hypothetical protein AB0N07_36265, partial [Streptomyces sp. NPDC051172]|uniref:hypothetical protein n=1 Tax=Streptomyces sp. NPDC051172 TaxID=3155796 RepID=UPI0034129DE1